MNLYRRITKLSTGVELHHPIAFWGGAGSTTLGVLLQLPDYLSTARMGYRMAGISMSPTMTVGMLLTVCGMILATYGLLPRLDKSTRSRVCPSDVFRAMDNAPLTNAHRRLLAVLGAALIIDVMKPATIAFILPGMRDEYGISTAQVAILAVLALTGTVLGSLLWGHMADHIGRRATILLSSLLFVSTTACGAMPKFEWNIGMCFFMGLGAGGMLPVVYTLMAESVPASKRGRLAVLQSGLSTAAGYLVTSGLAALLIPTFGWRMMWFANLPMGVFMLALNRWIPESPRFLIERGRLAEAKEVISRYGVIQLQDGTSDASKSDDAHTANQDDKPPGKASVVSGLMRLFEKTYRTQTLTIGFYALAWGIIYWGFITFLPTVLKGYSSFGDDGSKLLFVSSLLSIPGTILAAYLYSAWSSRKTMVLYGGVTVSALLAFAILGFAIDESSIVLIFLAMPLLTGSSGIIAMLSPYTAEVYSTDVRATGSGFAAACSKAGGMFGPPLVATVLTAFPGFTAMALLAAAPMAIATLVVAITTIETRGQPLEAIYASDKLAQVVKHEREEEIAS